MVFASEFVPVEEAAPLTLHIVANFLHPCVYPRPFCVRFSGLQIFWSTSLASTSGLITTSLPAADALLVAFVLLMVSPVQDKALYYQNWQYTECGTDDYARLRPEQRECGRADSLVYLLIGLVSPSTGMRYPSMHIHHDSEESTGSFGRGMTCCQSIWHEPSKGVGSRDNKEPQHSVEESRKALRPVDIQLRLQSTKTNSSDIGAKQTFA